MGTFLIDEHNPQACNVLNVCDSFYIKLPLTDD